jgi:hypothetical protein
MTILITEDFESVIIMANGMPEKRQFRQGEMCAVDHIRNNQAFNTSTILFDDGATAHGVSQMNFDVIS